MVHPLGRGKENERAADDHLVGERIEDAAQRRNLVVFSREIAVEPIGARRDDEHYEAGDVVLRCDQVKQYDRKQQPQAGQLVRQILEAAERDAGGFDCGHGNRNCCSHIEADYATSRNAAEEDGSGTGSPSSRKPSR